MGKGRMVLRGAVLAGVQAVSASAAVQSQQVSAALDSVAEILAELKGARTNAVSVAVAPAITTMTAVAPVTQSAVV